MLSAQVPLETGLRLIADCRIGFNRWQLALGEGVAKRVIRKFDLTKT